MKVKCPACDKPFSSAVENKQLVVWCANGPCTSKAGDFGVKAQVPWTESNERTLALSLALKVQEEMDQHEDYE